MYNVGVWWTHVAATGFATGIAESVAEPVAATPKLDEATLHMPTREV